MSTDFITLTCPSCGGKLQITNDIERFACGHCGNEHVVRRAGGIVSLAPVMETLQKVQASTDRVADELTVQRLTSELAEAQTRIDAAKSKLKAVELRELQGQSLFGHAINLVLILLTGSFAILAVVGFVTATSTGTAPSANGTPVNLVVAVLCGLILRARLGGNSFLRKARLTAQADLTRAEQDHNTLLKQRDQQRARLVR